MNDITFTILYLLVNLFGTYALSKVFQVFFKKPIRRLRYVYSSFALYFIVNSTLFLLFHNVYITLITNLMMYFIISLNYKAPFLKKTLFIILIYIGLAVLEILAIVIFNLFGINPLLKDTKILTIWITLFVNIVALIISSIILRNNLFNNNSRISFKNSFPIFILSMLILILAVVLPPLSYKSDKYITVSILTLCSISVFMYIFIDNIARISDEKSKKEIFSNQVDYYKMQIELMNRQQNNIRTIRHNIKGQIETIYTLIDDNEIESAKEFIGGIIDHVKISEKKVLTNIPELDSLLNYKINYADKMGIDLSITIRIEEEIKVKSYDYVSVLDNLINNAVDAVKDLENDKRKVQLVFGAFKGRIFIRVENAFEHEIQVTDDDVFKTSKKDTNKHGYGIEYIKSIVNKYNGKINIDYSEKFSVKISMHNSNNDN